MDFDLNDHALALLDDDGFVRVQPVPYGSQGTRDNYEALLPFGLMVRPKDPSNGTGCNLLVMRQGDDGRSFIGHDSRWMGVLPDFGDGGAALYATTELSGTKKTPFVGFFGEGGAEAEGTFKIDVPTGAGTATVLINATTGDITLTHPSGKVVVVTSTGVELGAASGGLALVKEPLLMAWISTLITALSNSPGGPIIVAPPSGIGTTLVKGT